MQSSVSSPFVEDTGVQVLEIHILSLSKLRANVVVLQLDWFLLLKGTGIVAAPVPKKVLQLAGITDCYTTSRGSTKTLGNFVKATFAAIGNTYGTNRLCELMLMFRVPYAGFVEGDCVYCYAV